MTDRELIWASLEVAAERCDDLVPLVYARLFVACPRVAAIFAVDAGEKPNPAMGSMVNELIALITDGIDTGLLDSIIMSTLINHVGWEIDFSLYRALLDALIDSVRASCGEQWSESAAAAWQRRCALIMDSLRDNQVTIDGQRDAVTSVAVSSGY